MSAYMEHKAGLGADGSLDRPSRCSFSKNIKLDNSGEIRVVHLSLGCDITQDNLDGEQEQLIKPLFYSNSCSTPEGIGLKALPVCPL
jgi:hypothetical protein